MSISDKETKVAHTSVSILPEIANRWSPRGFSLQPVPDTVLQAMLEAARWAPSSGNSQPWRFTLARKGIDENYEALFNALDDSNQAWAYHAPVIMIAAAKKTVRGNHPNKFHLHDLGQSMANFCIEGMRHNVYVHQMAGYHEEIARSAAGIPDDYSVGSISVIGYLGDGAYLNERRQESEVSPRERHALKEIAFLNRFGEGLPWLSNDKNSGQ